MAAVLLASSTVSFAQSDDVEAWKGVRLSYDHTFVNATWEGARSDDNLGMNGFSLGYVHSFKIAKKIPLFFETGLGFGLARWSENESEDGEEYKMSITATNLTLPLNVVYGFSLSDNVTLKPYTGFYLKANLSSQGKDEWSDGEESESEKWNYFDEKEVGKDGTWARCQFGWQIGATVDYKNFNLGIGYALDFNELAEKQRSSSLSVRVGMNF